MGTTPPNSCFRPTPSSPSPKRLSPPRSSNPHRALALALLASCLPPPQKMALASTCPPLPRSVHRTRTDLARRRHTRTNQPTHALSLFLRRYPSISCRRYLDQLTRDPTRPRHAPKPPRSSLAFPLQPSRPPPHHPKHAATRTRLRTWNHPSLRNFLP